MGYRVRSTKVGLACALLASACVSKAEPSHSGAAGTSVGRGAATGLTEVWRNRTLHPIDQPQPIGGVAVGIVTRPDHGLSVVGIDAVTGAKLWQQPLTPSWITPGVQVEITKVDDDKVAYFRPANDDRFTELVIADARTGRDLVRSPAGIFTSPANLCPGSRDVCTWIARSSTTKAPLRLRVTTGEWQLDDSEALSDARTLNKTGLLDLGDRPGNTLGLLRDGKLVWTTPVSAAFPPGFSSDHGWSWRLFADQHVVVGTVYGEPTVVGDKYIRERMKTAASAGLSEHTGEVLWRDPGSNFYCPLGSKQKGPYPIRCRVRGTSTYQEGAGMSFEGLDVTVEGFDVTTGKTTWSVSVGAAEELAGSQLHPAIAGETQAMLQGPAGPMVLDYATGRVTAPAPGATFWCMTQVDYEYSRPYQTTAGESKRKRPGGLLASICDGRGHAATELPSVAATMAAGARIGKHAVVATQDGYIGFKAR